MGKSNWKAAGKFAGCNAKRAGKRRLARLEKADKDTKKLVEDYRALAKTAAKLAKDNAALRKDLLACHARLIGYEAKLQVAVKKEQRVAVKRGRPE